MTAPRRRLVLRHCVVALVVCAGVGVLRTTASADPVPAPWNLDRINQENLPLDGVGYAGDLTGAGVDIYIVDTGINLTHEQFGSRAKFGVDYSKDGDVQPGYDCDGHGTHVAGIAAGTTVGLATGARVISVRVLDCDGYGTVSNVVKGLDWVRFNHRAGRLAIANLSLGLDVGDDGSQINAAIRRVVADGVLVVVAAGNGDSSYNPIDACIVSPPDEPATLAVGATDIDDAIASYSNFGPCVGVFAPGGDGSQLVNSASIGSDTAYEERKGTSMAAPLVSAYGAILAQQQPTMCPVQAKWAVTTRATPGVVTGLDVLSSVTPNRLLNVDTTPVPGSTRPGIPTNVQAVPNNGAALVTWDAPCNGLSPITGWTIGVFRDGALVRRVETTTPWRSSRIYGLRNGVAYQFTVRARNALGAGGLSGKTSAVTPFRFAAGTSVRTSVLFPNEGRGSLWAVRAESSSVCALRSSPNRLVGLRPGTCRVSIFPAHAWYSTVYSFTIE